MAFFPATFLAAVAGVAGNQLTGQPGTALAVFAVLLAVGMVLTYLLERHVGGRASSDDGQGAGAVGEPGEAWDLRGARGVQVGDGNQQTNYFGDQPGPEGHE